MDKIRILILTANPWDTKRLGLDEEFQRIQELWESAERRDDFELRYYPALRGEALQEKVLKFKPHLLHFSGHGENSGLVFADVTGDKSYEVSKDALAQLFKLCAPELQGVFLNACHSAKQADAIVEQVDYVVGMNTAIGDLAAISFSQGFYSAIFSQTQLNIEQAFEAGLSQMAIVQIAPSEQKKPSLQKRSKTYVPNFQHDVFISFADEDAQWTQDLSEYLRKQLKQQLAIADGFQLYSGNDFSQLPQSALLLIIASPEYCQHYAAQFEKIGSFAKQQPVFLVELACMPRHEMLKGLTPYKFWHYDDNEGIMSTTGDTYVLKVNDLVLAIAKRLSELKTAQQQQQRLVQQRREQQENRAHENIKSTTYAKALVWVKKQQIPAPSVFISYAWGMETQVRWVKNLAKDIEDAGIEVILDDWDNSRLGSSVSRFISLIENCDFIVVVGVPLYLDKYKNKVSELGSVVAAEVDLIVQRLLATEAEKNTVIPLLLEGEAHTALPPLLRCRSYGDFRDTGLYFPRLFDLILTLYRIEFRDSSVQELREILRNEII